MTHNDTFRRLRYILKLADPEVIATFALTETQVSVEEFLPWLKKEEDEGFDAIPDAKLAAFLNGLIIKMRGKKDGPPMPLEEKLTNNGVLIKLKIAFNYKADDILRVLERGGITVGKSELSALFRKPTHKNYRQCKDQFLRKFLMGLQLEHAES